MSIYKNIIDKDINNNQEYCYLKNITNNKINNLFNDISNIYKYKVSIKTPNKEYITHLIGKNDKYVVTYKDEKIFLDDIISIEVEK